MSLWSLVMYIPFPCAEFEGLIIHHYFLFSSINFISKSASLGRTNVNGVKLKFLFPWMASILEILSFIKSFLVTSKLLGKWLTFWYFVNDWNTFDFIMEQDHITVQLLLSMFFISWGLVKFPFIVDITFRFAWCKIKLFLLILWCCED